ncbi:MAG: hypothetical protein JW850_21805 [Thermoflexales bacterium]|nr:hypothetical protein [Thermoflexales bacterium]
MSELRAILAEVKDRRQQDDAGKVPGLFLTKLRDGDEPLPRYLRKYSNGDVSAEWEAFIRGKSYHQADETEEYDEDETEDYDEDKEGDESLSVEQGLSEQYKAWQTALGQLQMQMPHATFDTWVRQATVMSYENGMFVIGVHNGYAKDWLENRLHSLIQRTLSNIVGQSVQVHFVVGTRQEHDYVQSEPPS